MKFSYIASAAYIQLDAILLAGGRGKRLRPVTDYVPKPLVPVGNVPLIEWQMRYLKRSGIQNAIVCTGYRSDMIENYMRAKDMGIGIKFSVEESPLGTGGAIRKAGELVTGESFLVLNGDVLTSIDLNRVAAAPNVMAAVELRTGFGVLETDGSAVTGFREKEPVRGVWMNAGIYHLQMDVMDDLPVTGDIERTLFPEYAKTGRLGVVRFNDVWWYSIDSFKDIEECTKMMNA